MRLGKSPGIAVFLVKIFFPKQFNVIICLSLYYGSINTRDQLSYCILDSQNNGNYLESFLVDSDSYSTLFPLQCLVSLDLVLKHWLGSSAALQATR